MEGPSSPRDFATTHWSLIAAIRPEQVDASRAREAMAALCKTYWYPLYAFIRWRGHAPDEAQDLTQAFFARMIETGGLSGADPARGRFRSYLLGAVKHFLANEWHRAKAQKRGGHLRFIEWDAVDPEARFALAGERSDDPDVLFDREWALEVCDRALQSLRDEMTQAGKTAQFDALKGSLTGEEHLPRGELADRLNLSEGAVKVAIHRLRQRYRQLLRGIIAETVGSPEELEDELRYLITVLRGD
jgi:RNA polymerase sigma factor (sigma-70 family)